MKTVALHEARNRLSELIDQVQTGEVISITRNGRLCAQIVAPPAAAHPPREVAEAFQRLADLRRNLSLDDDLKTVAREGLD